MNLSDYLRDVPDFPKPGIIFKDITPLLADPKAFQECVDQLQAMDWGAPIDRIAGIESRGFLFGVPLSICILLVFLFLPALRSFRRQRQRRLIRAWQESDDTMLQN